MCVVVPLCQPHNCHQCGAVVDKYAWHSWHRVFITDCGIKIKMAVIKKFLKYSTYVFFPILIGAGSVCTYILY